MSGSSLDGLDIVLAELQESSGKWTYRILCADCMEYEDKWIEKLSDAINLTASEYQLLHSRYGEYLGKRVNEFIEQNELHHRVNLIASHGHTTFHFPEKKMTHQLGDGAAIAAVTQLPVVSDLRSLDVAFGGQGAPIVPMGEKMLFPDFDYFLNIGGIANISVRNENGFIAFDVCAANRVLNMLASEKQQPYDEDGKMAASGNVDEALLSELNALDYYKAPYPKSLANSFGTDLVFPLIKKYGLSTEDALCTYSEHIALQIKKSLQSITISTQNKKLMITGGGAFNQYLVNRLQNAIQEINIEVYLPEKEVIQYKEALIMALLGVLRWREQNTVISTVTGASRNSIGGALWLGTEA